MTKNQSLSEKDVREIEESLDENFTSQAEDSALAKVQNREISLRTPGLNIQGLEDVPASIVPVPFVRLIQYMSKNIDLYKALPNGDTEAPEGTFYFNDNQECFSRLSFVLIRAKHQITDFEREENGKMVVKPTKQVLALGITTDTKKLFILAISVSSFSNFGRLINRFKEAGISKTWEYEVVATASKKENDKGKFWVQDFELGDKLDPEQIEEMSKVYGEWGGVLDRDYTQEDMEGEE